MSQASKAKRQKETKKLRERYTAGEERRPPGLRVNAGDHSERSLNFGRENRAVMDNLQADNLELETIASRN
jgi:hypothetical protein